MTAGPATGSRVCPTPRWSPRRLPRTIGRSLAVAAVLAAVAACGGDDDGNATTSGDATTSGQAEAAADTPIGQALTAEFLAQSATSPISNETEARCVAGGIVAGVGEQRLAELGLTPDRVGNVQEIAFDADEVDRIVGAMFDCVDVRSALAAQFAAEFDTVVAACLADAFGDDMLRSIMASSFLGDDAQAASAQFFEEFIEIAAACNMPFG